MSNHARVSRRDLLKKTLLLGGAACAGAFAAPSAHAQKVSKEAMKYQDRP